MSKHLRAWSLSLGTRSLLRGRLSSVLSSLGFLITLSLHIYVPGATRSLGAHPRGCCLRSAFPSDGSVLEKSVWRLTRCREKISPSRRGEAHLPAALQAPPHDPPSEANGLGLVPSTIQLATRGSSPPVRGGDRGFSDAGTAQARRNWLLPLTAVAAGRGPFTESGPSLGRARSSRAQRRARSCAPSLC